MANTVNTGRSDWSFSDNNSHLDTNTPVFILTARDPLAPEHIRAWAIKYSTYAFADPDVFNSAMAQADVMEAWQNANRSKVHMANLP